MDSISTFYTSYDRYYSASYASGLNVTVPQQADTRPKVRVRNATFTKGKSEHAGAAPGGGGGSEGGGDSPGGFGAGAGRAGVRSGPRGDDIRSTASVGSVKVHAGSGSGSTRDLVQGLRHLNGCSGTDVGAILGLFCTSFSDSVNLPHILSKSRKSPRPKLGPGQVEESGAGG